MAERFVGIDVALRDHRIALLDRDGEAVGQSFTIAASTDGVATLLRTLAARGATAAQTLIGLEALGHLWENLEAALGGRWLSRPRAESAPDPALPGRRPPQGQDG